MTKRVLLGSLVVAVFLAGMLFANGAFAAGGSFAGRVDGSKTLIAIVANANGSVTAFACDGQRISEWFTGVLKGTSVDLKSPGGARILAELTSSSAKGTFTPAGGSALKFTSNTASGGSGLVRGEGTFNSVDYVGGWIILPDGIQAGLVTGGGKTLPAPKIIATTKTVEIPGLGTLGLVHTGELTIR